MNTFESVVYALFHGFTAFLPLSPEIHHKFVALVFNHPYTHETLIGALYGGSTLALLISLRHDLFSIMAAFLEAIFTRKKFSSLDEFYPLFILFASAPFFLAWFYVKPLLGLDSMYDLEIPILLGTFGMVGLIPYFTQNRNKKNKNLFDWSWMDSLGLGMIRSLAIFPGIGDILASISYLSFRNYRLDGTIKLVLITALPIWIGISTFYLKGIGLHTPEAEPGLSWLSFGIGALVSFVCSLFSIQMILKISHHTRLGGFLVYRVVVCIGMVGFFYFKRHSSL